MTDYKKKLIEVALPLDAINKASAREKSIRHGHPSTLHLWWARRPLAACRAMIFAQMVDDPSAHKDKFPTDEAEENERQRLFKIIEELVKWENSTNKVVLDKARAEIRKSCNGECPPVYDPFSGGGSIPLEAQRLGLKAYGSDLNPVAVLIGKALVEIPPIFAGKKCVNPDSQKKLDEGGGFKNEGARGLAEDVRYYGRWMRDEARMSIGHLYPQVEVTAEMAEGRHELQSLVGKKLTVISWLWMRTVASPNPALAGAHVPLVKSFDLSVKKKKRVWIEPTVDKKSNSYRFMIRTGEGGAHAGTVNRKGGTCLISGEPMPLKYIRLEGQAGRMGIRLMAIVAKGERGRIYLPATDEAEKIANTANPDWVPEIELPNNLRDFKTPNYGLRAFGDLFIKRQLVTLCTLSELVQKAHQKVLGDAISAGMTKGKGFFDGGSDAIAYADAIAVYLGLCVSKQSNRSSTICFWNAGRETVEQVFARNALPMTWDFSEGNPFSSSSGNFVGQVNYLARVIEYSPITDLGGTVFQRNAADNSQKIKNVVISTDPPYYDNIVYADLSDFFYLWIRKSLRSLWPKQFKSMLVPKDQELVVAPHRHESKKNAEVFFIDKMTDVMKSFRKIGNREFPLTIYYAYKQAEIEEEGISSTGWATFLQAIFESGLTIEGTWPVRTEQKGGLRNFGCNSLASSIVLVCRHKPDVSPNITRTEFLRFLRKELPPALKLLQQGNVAPVDMAQASIGPGMAIFTRHSAVLENDDKPMSIKTALRLINAELDEHFSAQGAEYDPFTRFAVTWFESYGMDSGQYGDAETLATARAVAVKGVQEAGIIESRGGKVRLLRRNEIPEDWDPAQDDRLTVWESTQHLIRILEKDGEQSAAIMLSQLGAIGEAAKDLAYRLYGVCERRKWTEEGKAYNGLVVSWPELSRLAIASRKQDILRPGDLEL